MRRKLRRWQQPSRTEAPGRRRSPGRMRDHVVASFGGLRLATLAQPLFEVNSVEHGAVHPPLELNLVVAPLAVEVARCNVVSPGLDANALRASDSGARLQPRQDTGPDSLALTVGPYRKQDKVSVFIPVLHDAETDKLVLLPQHCDVCVWRRDRPGNSWRFPGPRQPMLDQVARHLGDVNSVACRSELDVKVGRHAAPSEWEGPPGLELAAQRRAATSAAMERRTSSTRRRGKRMAIVFVGIDLAQERICRPRSICRQHPDERVKHADSQQVRANDGTEPKEATKGSDGDERRDGPGQEVLVPLHGWHSSAVGV